MRIRSCITTRRGHRRWAGPFTLTKTYKTAARKLAEKRIALAGARLAKILNEELK
jgi:hypothetical protein